MHDVPHGQRISRAAATAGPLHVLRLRTGARQRADAAMDPAATPRRVIALDVLAADAVRVVGRADAETGLARETAAAAAG